MIDPNASGATEDPPGQSGLTLESILQDEQKKADLASIAIRRFNASALYMEPYQDKWLRFYKIYRSLVDAVENPDEPNTGLAYAYGIIEDLVSKISEPILQMKPPCRVAPRRESHAKQADRFSAMAVQYFRTSRYQLEFTNSTREKCITGNAWEQDCWFSEYDSGRVWDKVKKSSVMQGVKSLVGKALGYDVPFEYEAIEERTIQTPLRVGYGTRFPSVFRIYPEPHVHNVRDMHWLCEEEPAAALADLKKRQFKDPATGQMKSFFNFSELEAAYQGQPGEIKPEPMSRQKSTAEDELRIVLGDQPEKERSLNYADDISRISLVWVWEPHRVFVIAQGRFIVAYQENVFQSPRIPYRLNNYTPQKDFLFGTGAIEPVELQLMELNDIHRMSMRNWVRIINRMVAYKEGAVPFADDWEPSAQGRIRVRSSGPISDSMMPIHHEDVTPSMLAQESNVKGGIERAISVADYSPGTEGTKQTHKTLGGLMEISRNIAQRITTVQRMTLAGIQDQMWFMEKLTSQFLMEKVPFTVYGPDGSTAIQEFDLWDISTGGEGFDFIIEYDPSFGDDQLRRNQLMALLNLSFQYIGQSRQLGLKVAIPDVEDIFRRNLMSFGWSDTSQIMKNPDGSLSPDDELKEMVAGQPIKPAPTENLIQHLAEHMAQMQMMGPLVQAGKIPPRAALLLQAHIQATQGLISQIMQNPMPLVQAALAAKQQAVGGAAPAMSPAAPVPGGAPAVALGTGGTPPAAGLGM